MLRRRSFIEVLFELFSIELSLGCFRPFRLVLVVFSIVLVFVVWKCFMLGEGVGIYF